MQLIKPSFEIIEQDFSIENVYKHIEKCGRTCYKSLDKITIDSAKPFIDRMIKSKHYAMLEHGSIYLKIPYSFWHRITHPGLCSKYINNPYSRTVEILEDADVVFHTKHIITPYLLVNTNLRVLVENGWEKDLKYLSRPSKARRITVKFICNRQIANEFVRHRVFSFAQESSRYCNYNSSKFNNELTFILPCWLYDNEDITNTSYYKVFKTVETNYKKLIKEGNQTQQAANILPNGLKTELIMTGFIEDWLHFFDLRALGTTGKPHPQAEELAKSLREEFIKRGYIKKD
jgi:thymidylate synthase (FAD)